MDPSNSLFFTPIFLSVLGNAAPIVLVVLLLICSALISGSEVALFSLTPAQRARLKDAKDVASKNILKLLEEPDKESGPRRLLATLLIANNTVNIAIVLVSTQLANQWFPADQTPEWLHVLINVVAITFVLVLFGEVVPKVYATGNNLSMARFMSTPMVGIQKLLSPLSWFLMQTTTTIEARLKSRTSSNISVDELGHALELTSDDNRSEEEHKILEGIVTFGAKEVGQIMTPRTDITALWVSDSFQEVLSAVMEGGYSRVPVYRDSIDSIAGFLFVKDLLPHLDELDYKWQDLIRQPVFVPENKKIDDLLQEFKESKIHLAIVVDEYGGTSGLVTLEDILEEIVGDISDEFDEEELRFSKLDERNYVFEGKTSLVDLYKILDIDGTLFEEARGDSSTLGGFVVEQTGRIPDKGDSFVFNDFIFSIESADKRKIKRVKITLPTSVSES